MGKPMSATPTPSAWVWQGVAISAENRCHTTTPLKGVVGGGACLTCSERSGALRPVIPAKTNDETFRASWGLQTMLVNVGVF